MMAPAQALILALRGILPAAVHDGGGGDAGGPLAEAVHLVGRNDKRPDDPSHGVLDPHDINNVGFFVLFAFIGLAFVVTAIWFFFWARNGGFHFKETDWDDYKTTVLRRRGPNGTLLSGATATTKLGGGSVYKDVSEGDGTTVVTETTALSGITAGASDIAAREKRRQKQERRRKQQRGEEHKKRGGRHVGDEGVMDEAAEKEAQKELRNYRHEKPARVGGLNKQPEGSTWDASATNASESTAAASPDVPPSSRPSTTPTKNGGGAIRKVYSAAEHTSVREAERIRAEARRLREESGSRTGGRRDFSYQRAGGAESAQSESLLEGSGSELGTKSYHHPMPELREGGERERERERARKKEERRARRGGYRRGRSDEEEL